MGISFNSFIVLGLFYLFRFHCKTVFRISSNFAEMFLDFSSRKYFFFFIFIQKFHFLFFAILIEFVFNWSVVYSRSRTSDSYLTSSPSTILLTSISNYHSMVWAQEKKNFFLCYKCAVEHFLSNYSSIIKIIDFQR